MVPSYLSLKPSSLITRSDEGYPSALIEDYYVFSNGDIEGMFAVNSVVPIQKTGKTKVKIGAGIKYNGMNEERIIYPMFNYYEKDFDLQVNGTDSILPVFSYVDNAVFPLIEDYDASGLSMEYNMQYKQVGDTLVRDNSSEAWKPGSYSGKVMLNSGVEGSFLEMYSQVFSGWPTFTPFYLEMDYKGNIPITVGLYATNNLGETSRVKLYILNPKQGWNKLYLNMEPEINTRGSNMQYRVFLSFVKGDVSNPVAWIDNLKVIYLD